MPSTDCYLRKSEVYTVFAGATLVGHYERFEDAKRALLQATLGTPPWAVRGYTVSQEEDEEAKEILAL